MADAFVVDNQPERIGTRSLFDMAMEKLRKNIHLLWEPNDTPLHVLLPLVNLVQNPAQLAAIEKSSPQLKDHLGPSWLRIIKSSVTGWEHMLLKNKFHSDGRPWTEAEVAQKATSRTYRNCLKRMKEEDEAAEEQLRQAVGQASAAARDKETLLIEKLPLGYMKKRKRGDGYDGTSGASQNGELRFGGGSRTKTTTARGVLTKIRREVKEARFSGRGGSLATPTHLLQERAKFLPQGMDHRFDDVKKTHKKPGGILRLTARPLSAATTSRLSSIGSLPTANDTVKGGVRRQSTVETAKSLPAQVQPVKPQPGRNQQAKATTNPGKDSQTVTPQKSAVRKDDASEPAEARQLLGAVATAPSPARRKRPPPTILMPPRRKRP